MARRRITVILGLVATVLLLVAWTTATERRGHHSALEDLVIRSGNDDLVVLLSTYFTTAGRCAGCHGHDPQGLASIDGQGRDVNVVDDWRSTMMANSARDPFFRAKLEHETLVNPGHGEALENKCLGCHAPLGMHESRLLGLPPFTAAMLDTSRLGLDGVSCLACHMQSPDSAGLYFSGDLHFDSATVYGPYDDDFINTAIMQFFVGFRPTVGAHILDGRACAGCHTLITETADLQGNLTGDRFVEQATWHEWKNSAYPAQGINCRGCHMPRIADSIILAAEYAFLPGQSPFGLHHLTGGNVYMLEMLKQHRQALGIPATEVQFDSTIARSMRLLQQHSVALDLILVDRDADTAWIDVRLLNLTGHKFPSGYPSRRAFVQLVVTTAVQDTLFASGLWDATWALNDLDQPFEPHHNVIRSPGQVQVYELVMGDVNGDVTTVLERAKEALKDNRLVPLGFTTAHAAYDTTLVVGVPAGDQDFNRDAFGVEGNGGDIVRYHVPLQGHTGAIQVHARVYYQPVPPEWNTELFTFNGARIDTFRTMVQQADGTPTLVAEAIAQQGPLAIAEGTYRPFRLLPNPTTDGTVELRGPVDAFTRAAVFDVHGRRVPFTMESRVDALRIMLPGTPGTYLLLITTEQGHQLERVVRLAAP